MEIPNTRNILSNHHAPRESTAIGEKRPLVKLKSSVIPAGKTNPTTCPQVLKAERGDDGPDPSQKADLTNMGAPRPSLQSP